MVLALVLVRRLPFLAVLDQLALYFTAFIFALLHMAGASP